MKRMIDRLSTKPRLEKLENREQPGSLLSAGLDASLLTDAFLGESLIPRSRLAKVTESAASVKVDAGDVSQLPQAALAPYVDGTTIEDPVVMERPDGDYAGRGPDLLFYGGNFNLINGLSNEIGVGAIDGRSWDDVRFRGAWPIDCAFSRNAQNFTGAVASADVTILGPGTATAGVANGGLPVAFNLSAAAATKTLIGGTPFGGYNEYSIQVCGLGLALGPGHYYLNVRPIMVGAPASGRSFLVTTSGAGSKGQPINNNDSWFSSTFFADTFTPAASELVLPSVDFSHGLCSAPTC